MSVDEIRRQALHFGLRWKTTIHILFLKTDEFYSYALLIYDSYQIIKQYGMEDIVFRIMTFYLNGVGGNREEKGKCDKRRPALAIYFLHI